MARGVGSYTPPLLTLATQRVALPTRQFYNMHRDMKPLRERFLLVLRLTFQAFSQYLGKGLFCKHSSALGRIV